MSGYLFLSYVTLVGFSLAAASHYLARFIGAPQTRPLPRIEGTYGLGSTVLLWLLSGPLAMMRTAQLATTKHIAMLLPAALAVAFALVWAFCLGVLALELGHRLFAA